MAAGPIRGRLHSSSSHSSAVLSSSFSKKAHPYSRPFSHGREGGVLCKLTNTVKQLFSQISFHSAAAIVAQPDPSPVKASERQGEVPMDILSDLILNPVFKKSKVDTFRQIARFFVAKGTDKLTKYEYDQVASILKRFTVATVHQLKYEADPFALNDNLDQERLIVQSRETPIEPVIIQPSRIFSAKFEYDDDESVLAHEKKILVPVPTEVQFDLREYAQKRKADRDPKQSQGEAKSEPKKTDLADQSTTISTPASIPQFVIPSVKPIDTISSEPTKTPFDFGSSNFNTAPTTMNVAKPLLSLSSKLDEKETEEGKRPLFDLLPAQDGSKDGASNDSSIAKRNKSDEGKVPNSQPSQELKLFGSQNVPLFSQDATGSIGLSDEKRAGNSLGAFGKPFVTDERPFSFSSTAAAPLTAGEKTRAFNFSMSEARADSLLPQPRETKSAQPESKPFSFGLASSATKPEAKESDSPAKPSFTDSTSFAIGHTEPKPAADPSIQSIQQAIKPFGESTSGKLFAFSAPSPLGQAGTPFTFGHAEAKSVSEPNAIPFSTVQPEQKPFSFDFKSQESKPLTSMPTEVKPFAGLQSEPRPFSSLAAKPFDSMHSESRPFAGFQAEPKTAIESQSEPKPFGGIFSEQKPFAFGQPPAFAPIETPSFGQQPFAFSTNASAASPQESRPFAFGQEQKPFTFGQATQDPKPFAFGQPQSSSQPAPSFSFSSQPGPAPPFQFSQPTDLAFNMGSSSPGTGQPRKLSTPLYRRRK